MVQITFTI